MIVKRIRPAKLCIILREHRHEVFDAAFQEELADLYQDRPLSSRASQTNAALVSYEGEA